MSLTRTSYGYYRLNFRNHNITARLTRIPLHICAILLTNHAWGGVIR